MVVGEKSILTITGYIPHLQNSYSCLGTANVYLINSDYAYGER